MSPASLLFDLGLQTLVPAGYWLVLGFWTKGSKKLAATAARRVKYSPICVSVPRMSSSDPPTSPGDSPRAAGRPGLLNYCFCPWTWLGVSFSVPFRTKVSVSSGPVGFLPLSLPALQSQVLWGLVFPVQDPPRPSPGWGT